MGRAGRWSPMLGWLMLIGLVTGCRPGPVEQGWTAYAQGRFEEAQSLFQAALKTKKHAGEAALALAELTLLQLDYSQAANFYRQAAARMPDDPRPMVGLAETLLRQGEQQSAYRLLLELLERFPKGEHVLRAAGLLGDAYAVTRLTRTTTDNYSPRFSPDGTEIFFTSHVDGSGELFRMPLETLQPQRVTRMPLSNEYAAQPTPDGKGLLFAAVKYRSEAGMLTFQSSGSTVLSGWFYYQDLTTGELRSLTTTPSPIANPALSPDGTRIAFEAIVEDNLDIWTMSIQGKDRKRWTEDPADQGNPVWLPDGRRLLYVGTDENNQFDLFLLDLETGSSHRIVQTAVNEYAGCFSPDGRVYVYPRQFGDAKVELAWMDWKTRRSYTISRGRGLSAQPAFSPDGSKIVFVSDRSDYLELYLMDLSRPVSAATLRRQLRARLQE